MIASFAAVTIVEPIYVHRFCIALPEKLRGSAHAGRVADSPTGVAPVISHFLLDTLPSQM